MKRTLPLAVAAVLLCSCSQSTYSTLYAEHESIDQSVEDWDYVNERNRITARAAAAALIASMSDAQRDATVLALDHEAHADWHYVPRRRRGLAIGDMTEAQRHDLNHLLQAGLSDVGYLKAMDIVWLESVLQELENGSPGRDPGRYTLLLFGDPAAPENATGHVAAWGWRFEGHHLSLNFTYTAHGVVTTPMFMGTAPAVVPSGLHAGKRILADEHNLAFAFIESLTDAQRDAMMLDQRPGDIITGPGREQLLREPAGLNHGAMTLDQKVLLSHLTMVYFHRRSQLGPVDPMLENHVFDNMIHFAWAGSTNPEEPHYYRIHGETFVIEYNCQGGVDHVHSVFHDLTDPLAEDLLRRHFEQHHADE